MANLVYKHFLPYWEVVFQLHPRIHMIIPLPAKHPIAGWLPALIPFSRKIQLLRITVEVIIRICSHAQLCSFMHPLRRHAVFQGFFLQLLKQLVFRFIWHKHLHAVILDDAIVFLSSCIILVLDGLAQLLFPFSRQNSF